MNRNKQIYPQHFFEIQENEKDQLQIINRLNILKNSSTLNSENRILTTQMRTQGDQLFTEGSDHQQKQKFLKNPPKSLKQIKQCFFYVQNFFIFDSYPEQQEQESQQEQEGLEDGKLSRFTHQRLIVLQYIILIFGSASMFITIFYVKKTSLKKLRNNTFFNKQKYDLDYSGVDQTLSIFSLWIVFFSTLITIIVIIFRYYAVLENEKSHKLISSRDTLTSTDQIYLLLLEIFLLIIQPYPFLNGIYFLKFRIIFLLIFTYNCVKDLYFDTDDLYDKVTFQFKVNHVLTILSLLKVYVIIRVLLKQTSYLKPRAVRICSMYGCVADYQYVIKCLFVDEPLVLVAMGFVISILVLSVALRIAQRPLNSALETILFDVSTFQNSMWCVFITMTTVGYGDMFARTMLGRSITFIIGIWGIFIVSVMVVVLTNMLNMETGEKRALTVLNRLICRKELRQRAAFLLTAVANFNFIERRFRKANIKQTEEYKRNKKIKLKNYTDQFRLNNRQIRNLNEQDNVHEQMARQFEFIKDNIECLNKDQKNLCKYIQDNFNLGLKSELKEIEK